MKKILLVACSLAFATFTFAQAQSQENSSDVLFKGKDLGDWNTNNNFNRRDASTGWYYPVGTQGYMQQASSNPSNIQSFVSLMFPDSTVWNLDNASSSDPTVIRFGHGDHSWGCIFDPTDEIFDITQIYQRYSKHNTYTWDSILFLYGYVRQIDDVNLVDTMFIRYYTTSDKAGIALGGIQGGGSFARISGYTGALGYSPLNFKTDTFLLTDADSTTRTATGWRTRAISASVNKQIPHSSNVAINRLIGFTLHFKPGSSYSNGDTLIDLTDNQTEIGKVVKKQNYMLTSIYQDNNPQSLQVKSPEGYYNNSQYLNKTSRYATNTNGWLGYIPGLAFNNAFYLTCGFHVSTQSLNIKSLENIGVSFGDIYPNPSTNSDITIPVSFTNGNVLNVTIADVTGKTVITTTYELNAGKHDLKVATNGLSAGIYTVTLEVSGATTTQKLTIH